MAKRMLELSRAVGTSIIPSRCGTQRDEYDPDAAAVAVARSRDALSATDNDGLRFSHRRGSGRIRARYTYPLRVLVSQVSYPLSFENCSD